MNDISGNSLKFEAEFFRKNNNLTLSREKKIRSFQMRTIHVLLLLFLTLLIGLFVYKAAELLLECDTLQVHSFNLSRQPVFAKEKIWEILRHSGGNILTLNLSDLSCKLLQLPEIEDVSISRILPDTVEIGFKLRQPLFYLNTKGPFQLMDASGLILGEQQKMPADLIPIRIRGNDRSILSRITVLAGELLPLRNKIEYVAYQEPYGIELKLLSASEVFYPGDYGFMKKINRYFKIKPHLVAEGSLIRYVDLRIAGRIYFEYIVQPQGDS